MKKLIQGRASHTFLQLAHFLQHLASLLVNCLKASLQVVCLHPLGGVYPVCKDASRRAAGPVYFKPAYQPRGVYELRVRSGAAPLRTGSSPGGAAAAAAAAAAAGSFCLFSWKITQSKTQAFTAA